MRLPVPAVHGARGARKVFFRCDQVTLSHVVVIRNIIDFALVIRQLFVFQILLLKVSDLCVQPPDIPAKLFAELLQLFRVGFAVLPLLLPINAGFHRRVVLFI